MRDVKWFVAMAIVSVSGCVDPSDERVVHLLPDACATTVVPTDAAPDAEPPACGMTLEGVLALGQVVTGSTVGRTNTYAAACGYGAAPDVAYRFVAPTARQQREQPPDQCVHRALIAVDQIGPRPLIDALRTAERQLVERVGSPCSGSRVHA